MSRSKAPAVECDMCGKPIPADAWHYLIERDNGALPVWCYGCAASSRAHRMLAPKCREYLCDIWFSHRGYRMVICVSRSVYWLTVTASAQATPQGSPEPIPPAQARSLTRRHEELPVGRASDCATPTRDAHEGSAG